MISLVLLYLSIYALSFFILVRLGGIYQSKKERIYVLEEPHINREEITVLIPFRNGEKRLDGLIQSINRLVKTPANFIFINDHSDDESVLKLKNGLKIRNYEILKLPVEMTGKKRALRYAAAKVTTEYTLTFDADVQFESNFFDKIEALSKADMYVLNAIMKSEKWYECFYEIDVLLVSAINTGVSGFARPIAASGANLLYRTAVFNRVDRIESHVHLSSGDDAYLLRDFRAAKCDVRLHTSRDFLVITETPKSINEFINQRMRWIGKTSNVKDTLSTRLIIFQTLFTLVFLVILVWTVMGKDWGLTLKLLGIKTSIDLFVFGIYFMKLGRAVVLLFVPIYELLFPIYTVVLMVLHFIYTPQWKGREIYTRE